MNYLKNISKVKTYQQVQDEINSYYKKNQDNHDDDDDEEADKVATAIFIQKYLISMGFKVNNELFKDNSKYFRNALVRANYTNYSKGVRADKKYLIMFFENLLLGKNNELNNDELKISKVED